MNQKPNRQNLLQHELIGLPVKIVQSFNPSQENLEGQVIDETMRTIILRSDNRTRTMQKIGTTFRFALTDGSKADVNGEKLLRRPEDRVKMIQGRIR